MRLAGLGFLMTLLCGGCASSCVNGVSLYHAPMTRWNAVEKDVYPDVDHCGECRANGYFTLAKYWPWLDDVFTKRAAKKCAKKILLKQQWKTKTWLGKDYKYGFEQAFIDVAQGSQGEIPAVPPPRYWNTHYRTPLGQQAAEQWFEGYRAGVALAASRLSTLNRVTASHDWFVERPQAPPPILPNNVQSPCGIYPPAAAMVPGFPPVVPSTMYSMTGPPPNPEGFTAPVSAAPDPAVDQVPVSSSVPINESPPLMPGHSGSISSGSSPSSSRLPPASSGAPQQAREGVLF